MARPTHAARLDAIAAANYEILTDRALGMLLRMAIRTLCAVHASDEELELADTRKQKVEAEIMRRVDVECMQKYGRTAGMLAAAGVAAEPVDRWIASTSAPELDA